MNFFPLFLSGLTLIFISCSSQTQEQTLDHFMGELIARQVTAGAAVGVRLRGKWILRNGYGLADIAKNTAVTESTQFRIMSVTKMFVAVSMMQLVNLKEVDLDAPVTKYLPQLPTIYNSVPVSSLLSHSSGIPDYVEMPGYLEHAIQHQTPWQVLKPVLNHDLDFTPGEKSSYSNSGYFLLGLVIERVTGQSLDEYLRTNIFEPLNMDDTYLEVSQSTGMQGAPGYRNRDNTLLRETLLDPSQYWAAGGMVTSLRDMITWDQSLWDNMVLPLEDIQQMVKPVRLADGSMGEYGLGFELMSMPGMHVAGNNGTGIGFNAANLHFLEDEMMVIVLTNTTNSNSTLIAKNIHDLLVGVTDGSPVRTDESIVQDKLDSLVFRVFDNATHSKLHPEDFEDADAVKRFEEDALLFIEEQQGKTVRIVRKGEKVNPQSIARKYDISFSDDATSWVIIFSKRGRILVTNRR